MTSPTRRMDRPVHLLPLSAKTEGALQEMAERYERDLSAAASRPAGDFCFTASAGRAHFTHRIAVVGDTVARLAEGLAKLRGGRTSPQARRGRLDGPDPPDVAFLFTGQGSQYVGMGRELFETEPRFRQTFERCDEILRPILDRSLASVLYPSESTGETSSGTIDQTGFTQPALFALEYALAQLWRSWGVEPTVVLGHSLGEYVAACVAGVFGLEDGLRLVARRARMMQDLPAGGAMAVLFAREEWAAEAIDGHAGAISIAAVNGSENTVISGVATAVDEVLVRAESEGIGTKRLQVSHAFHSALMDPMLDELEREASGIALSAPRIGIVSNVTGELADAETIANAGYWRRHTRQPVRFSDSMQTAHRQGYRVFLEIGPNPILLGMGRRVLPDDPGVFLPSLRRGRGDWQEMLKSLAELYVRGAGIDWQAFYQEAGRS